MPLSDNKEHKAEEYRKPLWQKIVGGVLIALGLANLLSLVIFPGLIFHPTDLIWPIIISLLFIFAGWSVGIKRQKR